MRTCGAPVCKARKEEKIMFILILAIPFIPFLLWRIPWVQRMLARIVKHMEA